MTHSQLMLSVLQQPDQACLITLNGQFLLLAHYVPNVAKEENTPRLNPSHASRYSIYLGWKAELT